MPDEVLPVAEIPSAPAPETTASPAPDASLPETQPETTPETTPAKMFTQEELDAAIGKRLAREQRKWEREQAAKLAQAQGKPQPQSDSPLSIDQFDSPEAYAEALAERKAEQKAEQRRQEEERRARVSAYHDREEVTREKYDDFDQVAYNPNVPITGVMAETIQASDIGPEVAYYLGSNVKEAERISRLSPFLQAKEIGRIEAKIASEPAPVKRTTSAPAPITPVTARAPSTPSFDTTDPRSIKSMSTSEWIEAERQRQLRKMQANTR